VPDVSLDVFIIGGGPVGLAAAIAARQKGLTVTVADSGSPPIDKACGEGVLPQGIEAALALGVDLRQLPSFPLRGIRFCGAGATVEAEFPRHPGAGIRRTTLHAALAEHAARHGVELRWRTPTRDLASIKARWIVGADGMSSRVRSLAGLDASTRHSRRFGFRRHAKIAPWSDFVEIYWGNGCQIYITPVAPDEVGIALLTRDPKQRIDDALPQFPALAARLHSAPHTSSERGGETVSRTLRRVARGNIALIGDASGSVDAITGEGLALGFHQARELADALATNSLSRYEQAHYRLARRPHFMANFMLTMDSRAWLRNRAIPALAARPEIFRRLLALHVGAGSPPRFAADCLALGWQMLSI
jgi:flavin-dependent dehydrogenase